MSIDFDTIETQNFTLAHYDQNDLNFGFSYYKDGIELMFVDSILNTISIDPSSAIATILDKISLHSYINVDTFIMLLDMLDVNWHFLQKHTYKQQLIIQLESGVQLSFKYQKGYGLLFSKAQKYHQ